MGRSPDESLSERCLHSLAATLPTGSAPTSARRSPSRPRILRTSGGGSSRCSASRQPVPSSTHTSGDRPRSPTSSTRSGQPSGCSAWSHAPWPSGWLTPGPEPGLGPPGRPGASGRTDEAKAAADADEHARIRNRHWSRSDLTTLPHARPWVPICVFDAHGPG
ncbi:hypothetical protein NOCARDAX2BIS_140124 [Nocardioides sp. AX2bis]|nr:hypothetical protein NOCARDAX2BIS_140124 [Nocardioides sp. AX2bis]